MNQASQDTYIETFRHLQELDSSASAALRTLKERGCLDYLSAEAYQYLNPEMVRWLVKAESHEGSEILYLTSDGKVRILTLSAYYNYPERYAERMRYGAFISAELEDGNSVALFVHECNKEIIDKLLEGLQKNLPLSTSRPMQERILETLTRQGHLSYLSREGLQHLNTKLMKYLDYAVNVRPGSEVIYQGESGHVNGDALEDVMRYPEKYTHLTGPFYLTLEVGDRSIIFDTQDLSQRNIWHLKKKADSIAEHK